MPRGSDPNRCKKAEVFIPLALQRPKRTALKSPTKAKSTIKTPVGSKRKTTESDTVSRHHSADDKLKIFQAHMAWVKAGSVKGASPHKRLAQTYGCSPKYPKRLFDKVSRCGSTDNQWSLDGRPKDIDEEVLNTMIDIIREHRSQHKKASCRSLEKQLAKRHPKKRTPSASKVSSEKRRLGFNHQSTLIAFHGAQETGRLVGVVDGDAITALAKSAQSGRPAAK